MKHILLLILTIQTLLCTAQNDINRIYSFLPELINLDEKGIKTEIRNAKKSNETTRLFVLENLPAFVNLHEKLQSKAYLQTKAITSFPGLEFALETNDDGTLRIINEAVGKIINSSYRRFVNYEIAIDPDKIFTLKNNTFSKIRLQQHSINPDNQKYYYANDSLNLLYEIKPSVELTNFYNVPYKRRLKEIQDSIKTKKIAFYNDKRETRQIVRARTRSNFNCRSEDAIDYNRRTDTITYQCLDTITQGLIGSHVKIETIDSIITIDETKLYLKLPLVDNKFQLINTKNIPSSNHLHNIGVYHIENNKAYSISFKDPFNKLIYKTLSDLSGK